MFNDWKEVIEADTENKLKVSSHLLWDVNISGLTPAKWQAMRFFVVQRVIERGDESDFYAIFKLYGGFDGVKEVVKQIKAVLNPRDEAFVRTVFDLRKEDLICYERKRLRDVYLNS